MRIRWLCTLLVVLTSTLALCQPSGNTGTGTGGTGQPGSVIGPSRTTSPGVELQVRVAWPDNRPVDGTIHLRLVNTYGASIQDIFTTREGFASFRSVRPGAYKIEVGGPDVEETSSEWIQVYQTSGVMMHWLTVKPRDPNQGVGGLPGGQVSAAEMRVPSKAQKEMEKGLNALGKNDLIKAAEHFQKATDIYPQFARAWNNLGVVRAKENNQAVAIEMWDKAIVADNKFAPAYFNKARVSILSNNSTAAEELVRKGLSVEPNNPEGLFLLANTQYANKQWNLALDTATKLHKLEHKRFSEVHIVAAQSLMQQGQHRLALDEFEIFLKESPDSPKVAVIRKQMAQLEARLK